MATYDKPKVAEALPADLLPVIRNSGVLTDKQFADLRAKVGSGEYPSGSGDLAACLIEKNILTEYQAARFLAGKSHGLKVGKYAILDRLGAGAMGRVYKAHHLLMGRVVALKVISPEIVTNERVISRFKREMQLVGRLDHPNVIRAFDADQTKDILYIVMEYATGRTIAQMLKDDGAFSPVEAVNLGAQAALGLEHAHRQGIVHRDVKPSNLLVNHEKQLKVLDLGLGVLMEAEDPNSFVTADGVAVGTVDYMSPEQACGREVDGRSDIFSLGCTLYFMIAGKQAFPGPSPIDRLGRRINHPPDPITDHRPDLPVSLVRVLEKMLASRPSDRYQSAGEVAEALQTLIRPRKSPRTAPPSGNSASPAGPRPTTERPTPTAPVQAPAEVVTVRPDYPGWFRPLAGLAEHRPGVALGVVAGGLGLALAAGVALGMVLKG